MPQRRYMNPESICAPPGNFSWVAQTDNTVYLAGQVGIDKDGNSVGLGDAGAQVRQAFLNIESTLKELGGTLDNIVKVTTYVVGKENLDRARAGRKQIMDEGLMTIKPASTLVVVAGLADDHWLVEVDATAVHVKRT